MTHEDDRQARAAGARPLTGADSFWLRMDHPTNLMMINGVMLFDEPLSLDRLRRVVERRVLPIPRFREIVDLGRRGRPRWRPCDRFELDDHVVPLRLPAPGDEDALRELVSRKMSEPLDFERPLWQFHVVENYGQGSALIGRFHHCMGDGIGLMMVLLSMTDLDREDSPDVSNPFLALFDRSADSLAAARRRIEEIMPEGLNLMLKPVEAIRALSPWQRGAASAAALARLTFRSADSKTLLNARLGIAKRAAWSEAIDLEAVKEVSLDLGGTVNDILLTAMSGGLRRYLVGRGGEAGCLDFRATVPVSLRPLEDLGALGNAFGLVYLRLPVEVDHPLERLAELRRRMQRLKRSAESVVSFQVMGLMGRLPHAAQRALVRMFASKATAVMTNVPGPNRQLYLAGSTIRDLIFWVPRSARLSLGVSIFSYAGRVRMGVATDAGLVPDPENIVKGFHEEFDSMQELARGRLA
jgi:WS/DGAT/MGAT family acyltransferase